MNNTDKRKKAFKELISKNFNDKHQTDKEYLRDKANNSIISDKKYHSEIQPFYDHLFMITVMYKRSNAYNINALDNHITRINNDFYELHKIICKLMIKGNINRQKILQPYCFMFIDGASTRSGGYFKANRAGENTHHHGVMLLHPDILKKLDLAELNNKLNYQTKNCNNIQSIEIKNLPTHKDFISAVDYSQKLATPLITNPNIYADLFFVLPHTNNNQMDKLLGRSSAS